MCHRAKLYFLALAAGAFFAAALAGAASFVDVGLAAALGFSALASTGFAAFSTLGAAAFGSFAGAVGAAAGVSAFGAASFLVAPLPPIDRIRRIVCCWR